MAAFGKQGAQVEGHRGAGRSKKHPKKTKSQIPHAKVCSRPTFPQAHPLTSLASIKITLRYGRKWPKDCIAQSIPLMCSSWWCHRAYSHEQHRPPPPRSSSGKTHPYRVFLNFSSMFPMYNDMSKEKRRNWYQKLSKMNAETIESQFWLHSAIIWGRFVKMPMLHSHSRPNKSSPRAVSRALAYIKSWCRSRRPPALS